MGVEADTQATSQVKRRWRVLAWIVAVLFTMAGVVLLVFVAMMADWTRNMQGASDGGENARFILTGLALPAVGIVLAVGLYRSRRWARVVFSVIVGFVALVAFLAVLGAFID